MSQQSIIIHPHGIFCVSIILLLLKQIKKAKKKGIHGPDAYWGSGRTHKEQQKKLKNLTSHVPIFNIFAGKFEAFSRSGIDLLSFFLESSEPLLSIEDSPTLDAWESLIWIKSNRDGLFFSRNPNGLGLSSTFWYISWKFSYQHKSNQS